MGIKIDVQGNIFNSKFKGLLMTDFEISTPSPQTKLISIPGRNGSLDLTESLGAVKYKDRQALFKFICKESTISYKSMQQDIIGLIHGQRGKIILNYDNEFYYEGRITAEVKKSSSMHNTLEIKAICNPYKLKVQETTVSCTATAAGTLVTCSNLNMKVIPYVTCTSPINIEYKGNTFAVGIGTNKIMELEFDSGENILKVIGSGSVEIRYREGSL